MNSKLKTKARGLLASTPVASTTGRAQDNKRGKKVKDQQENGSTAFGSSNTLSKSFEILPPDSKRKANSSKPTTLDMVCEAIQAIGEPRKGASYIAIRKWILDNKGNMEPNKLSVFLKKAFIKGIATGKLSRSTKSKEQAGLRGYFILPTKNVTKVKPKREDAKKESKVVRRKRPGNKETVSDSEMPTSKENHPKRLNLSDTMIEAIRKKENNTKVTKAKPGNSAPKIAKAGKKAEPKPKQTSKPTLKEKVVTADKQPKPNVKKPVKVKASSSKAEINDKMAVATKLDERKDLSDTELDVKRKVRKSLKSYSSDTDIDIVKAKLGKKKSHDQPSKSLTATKAELTSKRNRKATGDAPDQTSSKVIGGSKIAKPRKTKKGA